MSFDAGDFVDALTSPLVWQGARTTLLLGLVTYLLSFVVAVPLALGRTSGRRWLSHPCTAWIWLFRGVPLIVLLIFVYNALPEAVPALRDTLSDPFVAAAVALVLGESAYIAEALRTGLLAVEKEQKDAGRALGFGPLAVQRVVVLPIAIRVCVPALGNEFISNLKNTSLASVISLVELTLSGQRLYTQNFAILESLSAVAVMYLIMVTLLTVAQRFVEARLGRHMTSVAEPGSDTPHEGRAPVSAVRAVGADRSHEGDTVLEVRNIHKTYGQQVVLRDVSLQVRRGDVCVLLGRSGSGKSTLLRCLNRLETPESGLVLLNGSPLGYTQRRGEPRPAPEYVVSRRRRELGMVFQRFSLFPHLTAAENVAVAPRVHRLVPDAAALDYAVSYLEEVGLGGHASKYPGQLSGGQQQRVAIARALAMQPGAVLLDEPTSALDPESIGEVLLVLQQLARAGRTMVIASHELNFARTVADRIVFMASGEIAEESPPDKFFTEPDTEPARNFLLSAGSLT
ncbi:amino acid ABC transporter permease/ATP-binding protein [Pseudonocardia spinosispora]|uniref:amino acid ABC transporter permease/ATP-binding protein n=1 Tax=Pseudonocardia spinosispora TaxID=103441 RepID=UPI00040D836D|nr:amino acid ABC transporter permease/ATP-binding protein [Pseudonocardia spinosispora]